MKIRSVYSTGNGQVTVETEDGRTVCLTLQDRGSRLVIAGNVFNPDGTDSPVY